MSILRPRRGGAVVVPQSVHLVVVVLVVPVVVKVTDTWVNIAVANGKFWQMAGRRTSELHPLNPGDTTTPPAMFMYMQGSAPIPFQPPTHAVVVPSRAHA